MFTTRGFRTLVAGTLTAILIAPGYTQSSGEGPLVGAGTPLPILQGASWAYFKGTVEPPASWRAIAFDDSSWLIGPSGIGYGDSDDATVLTDMQNSYSSVYARRQFNVPSPASVLGLELRADYDDGFVAYINGTEVARRNAPTGTPAFNALATASHEAAGGASGNPVETINLNAFVGLLVTGTNVIAVQGLNRTLASTDLSMMFELRQVNAPPGAPSAPSPAPGATGVSLNPNLCVSVSDPDGGSLTATFRGREMTGTPADDFTIIALPDTQYYSASYPATVAAQTQWIVDNRVSRKIAFVTQLGDCVDNASVNQQLVNADQAWDIIEANPYSGQAWGVPYGIAVGNHDQTPSGDPGTLADEGATTTAFNSWFGISRYTGRGYYAGHYGTNNDNHYELFSASGMDFVALHIEFMPSDTPLRQAVLAWANGVLQAYPNRRAMLSSHYILETGTSTAFGNQGQAMYDALKGNANLFLMLSGHLDQASRRSDTFNGHTVHTLKSDYQTRPNGGNGWLRILTFSPQSSEIRVQTYSPTLGQFINNHADNTAGTPQNEFVLSYAMDGGQPFVTIGSTVQPSGGTACVAWPGRQSGKQYEWYVTLSDGTDTTTGSRNTFTTAANCSTNAQCADGNLCNGTETCGVGGVCQSGAAPNCNDGNACTVDGCLPATGCQYTALNCDDTNPCTTDSCAPVSGCQHQTVSCPAGEVCHAQTGLCQPPATTCTTPLDCADGDPCTTDTCDAANVAALTFDGTSDYVTMGAAPGLNASPAFTVEAWINGTGGQALDTTGTNGIANSIPLVAKGGPQDEVAANNMNYYLGLKNGTLVADFEDNVNGGNHPICGSTPIGTGWHHVAATYSGTAWALYVDGAAETLSVTCSTCAACTATPGVAPESSSVQHFALGTSLEAGGVLAGATPGYYGGKLDEVRVWNVARTQSQIQAARNLELTSGTGLIGRWGLNEGTGLATNDSTSPAEGGTLTNGPVWSLLDFAPVGTGTCAHAPIAGCDPCNGHEECLDANDCNGTESCSSGVCQPGTPLNCDDGNACTSDSCDTADGCQHGTVNCSDGVACTADTCDSILGCRHTSTCLPGQACSLSTGLCGPECTTAADCNDGITCTTDTCDPGLGCVYTDTPGVCSDGNNCTADACDPSNASHVSLDGNGDYIAFGLASTHTELGAARFTLEAWVNWDGTTVNPTSTGTGGLNALPIVAKGRAEAEATNQDMNYFFGIQGGKLAADFEEGLGVCLGGSNPGASCYVNCSVTTATRCSLASQCPAGETCSVSNGCTGGGTCDGLPGLNHPVVGATTLTANAWAHVAATYDGNCWQLYLNGTPDGAPVCTGNRPPRADSIQHFAIGTAMTSAATNAAAGYFPGAIDEVRVWNYARTASQIRGAMNGTIRADSANPAARLIGRWGFDEGSGTTAGDSAGYANDGTLTGNAAFSAASLQTLTGCVSAYAPVAGCCATNAHCNDGNAATTDTCSAGSCIHTLPTTCATTPDCNDNNACTTDACVSANVSALQFDGTNDYVTMGAAAGTGALGATIFTLETWFKRTGTGTPKETGSGGIASLIPLVSKGAAQAETPANVNANYILGINTAGNVLAADFEDAATGLNHPLSGTTPIVNGIWYHAAATYDGTTWRLYLNGSLEATLVIGTFTPESTSIQHFGLGTTLSSTGVAGGFFAGLLDEVRVWNVARSLAQIQAGKDQELTSGTGLIGRWGLNENTGTTAADATTPAQNGTLTGGPVWSPADKAPFGTCSRTPIAACCTTNAQCDDGNPCTTDSCNANSCSHTNNAASCNDGNACTFGDVCTAGTCGGTAINVPGEVTNLRFGSNHVTFTWNSVAGAGPGTTHDVVRGVVSSLPVGTGPSETCFAPDIAVATATDSTSPTPGQTFWYLVRGANSCGTGTYGWRTSHGVPTVQRTTASCP